MPFHLEQLLQSHTHASATAFTTAKVPEPGKEVVIMLGKSTAEVPTKQGSMEEIRLMCRGNELVLAQLGPPDATSAHNDTVGTTVFSCENGNPCEDPTPKDFIKKEEGTPYATCTSGANKIYLYKDASTLDHIGHDYESRYANTYGGRDLQLGYQSGPKTNEVFIQTVNGGFECTFKII